MADDEERRCGYEDRKSKIYDISLLMKTKVACHPEDTSVISLAKLPFLET